MVKSTYTMTPGATASIIGVLGLDLGRSAGSLVDYPLNAPNIVSKQQSPMLILYCGVRCTCSCLWPISLFLAYIIQANKATGSCCH